MNQTIFDYNTIEDIRIESFWLPKIANHISLDWDKNPLPQTHEIFCFNCLSRQKRNKTKSLSYTVVPQFPDIRIMKHGQPVIHRQDCFDFYISYLIWNPNTQLPDCFQMRTYFCPDFEEHFVYALKYGHLVSGFPIWFSIRTLSIWISYMIRYPDSFVSVTGHSLFGFLMSGNWVCLDIRIRKPG